MPGDGGAVAVLDVASPGRGPCVTSGVQDLAVVAEVLARTATSQGKVSACCASGSKNCLYPPKTSSADSPDSATVECSRIALNSRYSEASMSPKPIGRSRARMTFARTSGSASASRVEHDVLVVGAGDARATSCTNGASGVAAQLVGHEVLGLADEVDREAAHPSRPSRRAAGRRCAVMRGGVEAAGQQGAARHVGDELAAHDVVEQLTDVGDRGVPVVGVRHGSRSVQ